MQADLAALYDQYKPLIDSLEEQFAWISDVENYNMLYMSKKAQELIGFSETKNYRCQKCYQVLQGINRPCTFCPNNKLSPDSMYCWTQFNSRVRKWISIEDQLIVKNGRSYRVEIARLINNAEEMSQLNSENILLQSIQTLTTGKDFDDAINTFLEMVGGFYFADRTYVFEFDYKNNVTNNIFEWCGKGVTPQIGFLQNIPISEVSEWIEAFKENREYIIRSVEDDLDHESDTYKRLVPQNISSLLVAPLFMDNQLFGFIGVDNPELRIDNINLLRATTDVIAVELEKHRILERLEYLSYTDLLTGVYNRNRYIRELNERYVNPPKSLGIIVADINGMKGINDQYGHSYGDKIIVQTAQILKNAQPYPVYRVGGDEFIVPCPDIERAEFQTMVQAVRSAFSEEKECDVCIGTSWNSKDLNIDTQIALADELLYIEKQSHYSSLSHNGKITRTNAINAVMTEIQSGSFVVHYQPQVNLSTGEIVAAEALVRKLDANGKTLSPAQFIMYYEAQGVQMYVDLHVFESVLQTINKLKATGCSLPISINFSRTTLMMHNFVDRLKELMKTYDVSPNLITIEVTETISKLGNEPLVDLIEQLEQAGIRISLDDFGTQYSNLSMITDMGFEEIKLDKTLVNSLGKNPRSEIVVKNIIRMCRDLTGIDIVAEGIEMAEQAELLRSYQCDIGQGYYFYQPMSEQNLLQMLKDNPGKQFDRD